MNIEVKCPQCERRLRILAEFAGKTVRCPGCKAVWTLPPDNTAPPPPPPATLDLSDGIYGLAPAEHEEPPAEAVRATEPRPRPNSESAAPVAATAPTEVCPSCGSILAANAVVCIDCGFNRQTGKKLKTVSERFERHWDSGGFPYGARLVAWLVLLPLCAAPLLMKEPDLGTGLLGAWVVILLPLLGTLQRVIVTRESDGRPVLIRKAWLCFVPYWRSVTDLERYARLRTGAKVGGFALDVLMVTILLFLLCGIPGLVFALIRARSNLVTLEVVGDHDGPDIEPVLVYGGGSEATMAQIGDTLKEIAGLPYG